MKLTFYSESESSLVTDQELVSGTAFTGGVGKSWIAARRIKKMLSVLRRRAAPRLFTIVRRGMATGPDSLMDQAVASAVQDSSSAERLLAEASDASLASVSSTVAAITPEAIALPLGSLPPDMALRAVDTFHMALGLDWWLAIGACTLSIRLALLPMALHGSQQQGKMQGLRAELAPLQARMQSSGGTDHAAADEMRALYERHGVNPMRLLALPLLQLPIFMSFFLGLRRLADHFPDARSGGAYWFVDLSATDTSYWLPAASGLSALALVRLSVPGATAGMNEAEAAQADLMKQVLSGVTLFSLPVAATMPASVLMFWITNNAFSLVYTTALQLTPTRAMLGLGPLPAPADASQRGGGGGGGGYPLDFSGAAKPGSAGAVPHLAAASPLTLPPDRSSVAKAQSMAADTLSDLAAGMADRGKLAEAASMQGRAVALREEAAEASKDEPQAEHLRIALWRLVELQEQAGQLPEAEESLARWERAGGDAATAQERQKALGGGGGDGGGEGVA